MRRNDDGEKKAHEIHCVFVVVVVAVVRASQPRKGKYSDAFIHVMGGELRAAVL
jgi:hypothetical protein